MVVIKIFLGSIKLATQHGAPDRDFYFWAPLGMFEQFKAAALLSLGAYQKRMQTPNVPEPSFHNLESNHKINHLCQDKC